MSLEKLHWESKFSPQKHNVQKILGLVPESPQPDDCKGLDSPDCYEDGSGSGFEPDYSGSGSGSDLSGSGSGLDYSGSGCYDGSSSGCDDFEVIDLQDYDLKDEDSKLEEPIKDNDQGEWICR